MTPEVEIQPLSQKKRKIVFLSSLLLFVLAVPFSVFYAIGYRFDFSDEFNNIKSVGGMYVRNDTENTEMFINDEPVRDMRVFQKAAYIQNLEAGMHRLHIQGDGVQTWVKELPVYAHFVTEVTSFNMPRVPQIRLITEYTSQQDGRGVVFDRAATTTFDFASTTTGLMYASTTATTTFAINPEYAYVKSLMASSTEVKELILASQEREPQFTFEVAPKPTTTPLSATSTQKWRDYTLLQKGDEVFIRWDGSTEHVPYYYCVLYGGQRKTSLEYGAHVYAALLDQFGSKELLDEHQNERVCRTQIRIDRKGQEVQWFGFFPDNGDLVLMHLEDGLYAVEVDDRAWQNTQLLYPGEDLHVIQEGGRIYVQDGEYYLEVFTELATQS